MMLVPDPEQLPPSADSAYHLRAEASSPDGQLLRVLQEPLGYRPWVLFAVLLSGDLERMALVLVVLEMTALLAVLAEIGWPVGFGSSLQNEVVKSQLKIANLCDQALL